MTKPGNGKPKTGKPSGPTGAEPTVEIDSEVTRNIRQHARAHSKTEVCGVLIGEFENDTIDICASIEGLNAAQAGTHVTFTQDAWEAIYRVKDDLYPDQRIVGWYHSPPRLRCLSLRSRSLYSAELLFLLPDRWPGFTIPIPMRRGVSGGSPAKSTASRSYR